MRKILKEGDVISAEIQCVYNDGSLGLHTRSVKYGKVYSDCIRVNLRMTTYSADLIEHYLCCIICSWALERLLKCHLR